MLILVALTGIESGVCTDDDTLGDCEAIRGPEEDDDVWSPSRASDREGEVGGGGRRCLC